jgi:hypothetical protein
VGATSVRRGQPARYPAPPASTQPKGRSQALETRGSQIVGGRGGWRTGPRSVVLVYGKRSVRTPINCRLFDTRPVARAVRWAELVRRIGRSSGF